jgi:hypothetical protein
MTRHQRTPIPTISLRLALLIMAGVSLLDGCRARQSAPARSTTAAAPGNPGGPDATPLEGSRLLAQALATGKLERPEAWVSRYGQIRVFILHDALEPPMDVEGQVLTGGESLSRWLILLRRQVSEACPDPDACRYRTIGAPAEDEWRCEGRCCELPGAAARNLDHRSLLLIRACFAGDGGKLSELHLRDGD